MNWFAYLEKDKPLSFYFASAPSLDNVYIHQISLIEEDISLRFDLKSFPETTPEKWDDEFNTLQITLKFLNISNLIISGWVGSVESFITLEKLAKGYKLIVSSESLKIECNCEFIALETSSAYCDSKKEKIDSNNSGES